MHMLKYPLQVTRLPDGVTESRPNNMRPHNRFQATSALMRRRA